MVRLCKYDSRELAVFIARTCASDVLHLVPGAKVALAVDNGRPKVSRTPGDRARGERPMVMSP